MEDAIMEILDDYYGDSRDVSYKEEIAEFIEVHYEDIKAVMEG